MRNSTTLILFIISATAVSAQLTSSYQSNLTRADYYHSEPMVAEGLNPVINTNNNFQPFTDYLQKSKNQKKAATIFLLSGAGLIITSFVIPRGELLEDGICIAGFCSDKYENDGLRTGVFIAGGLAALTSIPFFIVARKNKKKANLTSAFFQLENTTVLQGIKYYHCSFPSLGLKISL